jgi:hypothetical protein
METGSELASNILCIEILCTVQQIESNDMALGHPVTGPVPRWDGDNFLIDGYSVSPSEKSP